MMISILLADDSTIIRKILKKELPTILNGRDIKFTEAVNGAQALDLLIQQRFDLVFLDLTMPEKTGYQVLESLKEKDIKTNTIVLTADIQPEAERIVKSLGAIGYVKKERPLNVTALIKTLEGMGIL